MISPLVDGALELDHRRQLSRIGYSARSRLEHWSPPDRVEGRVVLVTGATSGIGRSIADEVAGLGAVVIVVGRDESRGQSTVKAIIERTDNGEVSFERADLSRLADVRDLADRVAHSHPRLDVLVHNAGALSRAYVRTQDGLELTVAVHVVAPFLLTHLLMGQLRAAPDGRVITMSSGGMYSQRLDVAGLQPHADDYDGVKAYAASQASAGRAHPAVGPALRRVWPAVYRHAPGLGRDERPRLGTSPLRAPREASAADTRTRSGHRRVARDGAALRPE